MTATSTSPGSTWYRAAGADELADGGVKICALAGRTIALVRQGGQYGALDNRCPHMGGPLGEGIVEYGLLVCPWHGRGYDPITGECDGFADRATVFPVAVRDDGIYVEIRSKSET